MDKVSQHPAESGYNRVVLSFGSNCEPRRESVKEAIAWISGLFARFECSQIYETPEYHGSGKLYMNAVGEGYTALGYDRLNGMLKDYESRHGRDDEARREGRVPIDIDIVKWNDEIIRSGDYSRTFFSIGYQQLAR